MGLLVPVKSSSHERTVDDGAFQAVESMGEEINVVLAPGVIQPRRLMQLKDSMGEGHGNSEALLTRQFTDTNLLGLVLRQKEVVQGNWLRKVRLRGAGCGDINAELARNISQEV